MSKVSTVIPRYRMLIVLALLTLASIPAISQPNLRPMAPQSLEFTANNGQVADMDGQLRPDILYYAEAKGVKMYVSRGMLSYVFMQFEGDVRSYQLSDGRHPDVHPDPKLNLYRMDMEFVGANPMVAVESLDATEGYRNFYLAHCPQGVLRVKSYRALLYRELYNKIDMVMRTREDGNMKIDFVIHPGGNPSDIRIRPVGASTASKLSSGGTRIETPLGFLEEDAPYAYAVAGDLKTLPDSSRTDKTVLHSQWNLSNGIYTYTVEHADSRNTIVIDPTRRWATFVGGSGAETMLGGDITEVDQTGNVFLTGSTTNASFPTSSGAWQTTLAGSDDVFIMKLQYDNARLWATLYGGTNEDRAHGIASDFNRGVFIAGHTVSTNFPTTANTYQPGYGGGSRDAFCVKFDSAGQRLWSTFFGGNQLDDSYGFAMDSLGNPCMVLTTVSTGLATLGQTTKSGGQDAMLVRFYGLTGTRNWSTYFGGSSDEEGYCASTDPNNNILIGGWTLSSNLPVTSGCAQPTYAGGTDAYVAKYSSGGNKLWATYLGGSSTECDGATLQGAAALATDQAGNTFMTGYTSSTNFPTNAAFQGTKSAGTGNNGRDAFITKYDTSGAIAWSTYYGSANVEDVGVGVATNNSGSVLVTGYTTGLIPGLVGGVSYQTTNAGGPHDAFVVKMNAAGNAIKYATLYGGNAADDGIGISFDPFGSIFFGGSTNGGTFPTIGPLPSPPWPALRQGTYGGGGDGFLVMFCDIEGSVVQHSGPDTMCIGDTLWLSLPLGYKTYKWNNVTADSGNVFRAPVNVNGDYYVDVTNYAGCSARSDTVHVRYRLPADPVIPTTATVCQGDTFTITVTANVSQANAIYRWYDGTLTGYRDTVIGGSPRVWTAGTYRLIFQDQFGCIDTSNTFTLNVVAKPLPVHIQGADTVCEGDVITLRTDRSLGVGEKFTWSGPVTGNGATLTPASVVGSTGRYYLTATKTVGAQDMCPIRSDSVWIKFNKKPTPTIGGATSFCVGDSITIQSVLAYKKYLWTPGKPSDTLKTFRVGAAGTYQLEVTDSNGCKGIKTVTISTTPKPKPVIRVTPLNKTICQGDTAWLEVDPSFATYRWNPTSPPGFPPFRMPVTVAGKYFITVGVAAGTTCEGTDSVVITVVPKPSGAVNGPIAVCVGSTQSYKAVKTPGLTYTWSVTPASASFVGGSSGDSVAIKWGATAGAGKITLRITDPTTGCFTDVTKDIVVGSGLKPSVNPPSGKICPGDSITIGVGAGYKLQQWKDNTGTVIGTGQNIVIKAAGTYTVYVEDNNNCTGTSDPITITIAPPPTPTIQVLEGRTTICPGGNLSLDVGTTYDSLTWGNGQRLRPLSITDSGTYTVRVWANGCSGTSSIRIDRAVPPAPTISGPSSVCINSSSQYTVPGGPAAHKYFWTVNGGVGSIASGQGSNTITVNWTGAGAATIEVSDTDNVTTCFGTAPTYPVNVGTSLTPTIATSTGKLTMCDGDKINLSAPGYVTYTWKNSAGVTIGTTDNVDVTTSDTYTVAVSDGTCSGTATITITRKAPVIVDVTPTTASICQGDSVKLTATAGLNRYLWSDGQTTQTIMAKTAGSYSVTGYDVDNCSGVSQSASVTVNPIPVATISQNLNLLTALPPGMTYQWMLNGVPIPLATQQTYNTSANGDYTVIVTGVGGCKDTSAAVTISGQAMAVIGIGNYTAAPGEHFNVPIELRGAAMLDWYGMKTYTVKVRFNKKMLLAPTGTGITGIDFANDRIVTVTGNLPANAINNITPTNIIVLDFVATLGDSMTTPLKIESFVFGEGNAAITLQDGLFTLNGICETSGKRLVDATGFAGLKSVRPNPATTNATINYELIEDGPVRIQMVNVAGQALPVWSGNATHGQYVLDVNTKLIPSGKYIVLLTTQSGQWTMPLSIEK